jgi:signal transduction histidine kinase
VAQSALQNRVVFLQRHGTLMDIAHEQLFRIFNVDALVCIPLSVGSKCLGLLIAGVSTMLLADLQPRERFLQSFGVKAAAALKDAARDRGEIDRRITLVREEHNASSRRVLHEVNNPLAIIKNYLGVLNDKLARQEPVGEAISVLNEEIDRVANMLHEFVGAASNVKPAQVDINRIASNLVHMFRDSKFLPPGVEIVERLSDQECWIEGSADTVKQVLINLIKNSVEAMPKSGRIEVISYGRVRRSEASFVHLCVKDNGPGIPADQLSQIFSPLTSIKPGVNRGIGLSIVHGLVKKLGGQIECVSASGGTEFHMYLPAFGSQKSVAPTPYELDLL